MKKISLYCAFLLLFSCHDRSGEKYENTSLIDQWYGPHHFDEKAKTTETKEDQVIEGTLSIAEAPAQFEETPAPAEEKSALLDEGSLELHDDDTLLLEAILEKESITLDESSFEGEVLSL